jgi:Protein of unknown function (DUF2442)
MRVAPDAEQDSALAVASVQPRVRSVRALPNYELLVAFDDGVQGVVACRGLVFGDRAGVFSRLQDEALFAAVAIEHGAMTWEGELDLAPDAMYDQLVAHRRWELA